ncbi:SIR2 family protein [bacterium]|nr:SIR2 family protein [bacterium]
MSNAPDLREIFDPPDEIIQAGLNGELVLFVGAGASMLLGLPSWGGLAADALGELRKNGSLNYSQIDQLKTLDPKKQLSIAYLIAEENGYKLDLGKYLTGKSEGDSIYKAINDIGCPCVTTNYDELIAPRFIETKDGSTTAAPVVRISERDKFYAKLLNEPGTVVHLHGAISKPETMIVTTKEYLEHYDHENVQEFLGELFEKKTILFLGYGLEEAEILEYILRRGSVKATKDRRRFALQGFFRSQQPLYENLHNYYEKSFGVHLLGFIRDHENYKRLEGIVKAWANQIEVRKPLLANDADYMDEVLGGD